MLDRDVKTIPPITAFEGRHDLMNELTPSHATPDKNIRGQEGEDGGGKYKRRVTPSFVRLTEETPSHAKGDDDGAKYMEEEER